MYKKLNIDYIHSYLTDNYYVINSNITINRYDSFHNKFLYKNESLLLVSNNKNVLHNFIKDMEHNNLYTKMIEIKPELGTICKNIKLNSNTWYDLDNHKIVEFPSSNNCKYVFFNYRIFSDYCESINSYNFLISLFFCSDLIKFKKEYYNNSIIDSIRTLNICSKTKFSETEIIYRNEESEKPLSFDKFDSSDLSNLYKFLCFDKSKETNEISNIKEIKEISNIKEIKEIPNIKEIKEISNMEETKDIENIKETKDIENIKETKEIPNIQLPHINKHCKDIQLPRINTTDNLGIKYSVTDSVSVSKNSSFKEYIKNLIF